MLQGKVRKKERKKKEEGHSHTANESVNHSNISGKQFLAEH